MMILHYLSRKLARHILLFIYVDDIIIISDDFEEITSLNIALSHHFAMKDLSVLHYFLGIEVVFLLPKVIFCPKYIVNLFVFAQLTDNKIVDTPR